MTRPPGTIRDSIIDYLSTIRGDATATEITDAVSIHLGGISASSVRSYLNLNVPEAFERTGRGRYRLKSPAHKDSTPIALEPTFTSGKATLYHADCFDWLAAQEPSSIHAVVTDPPYGLVEYTEKEQTKLRNGKGGVWRIPPSFDGHRRSPLPRFTVLKKDDLAALYEFFWRLGILLLRAAVPGANVLIASNPLLAHVVLSAMSEAGLEVRGSITRLVMTMRGGDRPKNAHAEFPDVSVMPRSMFEPWVLVRKPLEGRVQDNLRKWKTGGFRRPSQEQPFGDVIKSRPTASAERQIAPHPSLKPQELLRKLVRAALPLGEGVVYDPFAGSGSTLAAANAVGYQSIGTELDEHYIKVAQAAIPKLASLRVEQIDPI
jgi:DNA modification methylase